MFCESYRQSLTDAAASRKALPREAEEHLAACREYASALAVEQETLRSIDRSLRVAVNADVPASLVPRVREEILEGAAAPGRFSWRAIFVPATAVLLLSAALLVVPGLILDKPLRSSRSAVPENVPPSAHTDVVAPKQETGGPKQVVLASPKKARRGWLSAAGSRVRVQPATQANIARVIRFAREQPEAAKDLLISAEPAPIVIEPIEVASIAWPPLFEEQNVNNQFEPRR